MPFKSDSQRRFMYSQHPKIAKRWEKETPKVDLPDKVAGFLKEAEQLGVMMVNFLSMDNNNAI